MGGLETAALAERLIGRQADLGRLVGAIGADRSVAVVGEAGVGKTSLIRAALTASGREHREGGGFATLTWLPYLALRRAIGREVAGEPVRVAAALEHELGPDVLFVDDLQWVDASSRAALELLAGRVQILTAIRAGDAAAEPVLRIVEQLGFQTIELAGLADDDATALVERLAGQMPTTDVARTVRLAGGNPLLLEEMARGGPTTAVLGRGLERRRARLRDAARDSLDMLAVAGRPLAADRLAAGAELVASGLVRRRGSDLEIRHALLAEAIVASLDAASIQAIHSAAAGATDDLSERARHLLAAGRADDAAAAARQALAAAPDRQADAVLRVTLARATGALADELEAARALIPLGGFADILGVIPEVIPADADLEDRRYAMFFRGTALMRTGHPDQAWTILADALAAGPRGTRASALAAQQLAVLAGNQHGDPGEGGAILDLERPHLEDGSLLAAGLDILRETLRLFAGEAPDLDLMISALERGFDDDGADVAGRASNLLKALLVLRGANPALALALDIAERLRRRGDYATDLLAEASRTAMYAGRLGEAVALADGVLEEPASLRARMDAENVRIEALACLGRFDLAEAALAAVQVLAARGSHSERAEIMMAEAELGYWSGASRRTIDVVDRLFAHGSSSDVNLVLPAITSAWAALDLGRPIPDIPAHALPALAGIPFELEGIRALAENRPAAAIEPFSEAARRYAGFLEVRAAHSRWASAEAARRAGLPDAIERLRVIELEASAMQFEPLVAKIRRSLRLAGIRVSAPRETGERPLGLSAREAEVVRLVERGLTNVEIARRLGLGRPTINRMLSSAMGKLGVERRSQLAALGTI